MQPGSGLTSGETTEQVNSYMSRLGMVTRHMLRHSKLVCRCQSTYTYAYGYGCNAVHIMQCYFCHIDFTPCIIDTCST